MFLLKVWWLETDTHTPMPLEIGTQQELEVKMQTGREEGRDAFEKMLRLILSSMGSLSMLNSPTLHQRSNWVPKKGVSETRIPSTLRSVGLKVNQRPTLLKKNSLFLRC